MYSIYKHTCPNGKVYIGITNQEPEQRWNKGLGYQKQNRFFAAIVKFGWDNILHEVIAQVESQSEATRIEKILILSHKANVPEYGYNVQGGYVAQYHFHNDSSTDVSAQKPLDGRGKLSQHVAQYSKDGVLLATYNSMKEASILTGVNHGDICSCCQGRKSDGKAKHTAGGYIWKYVDETSNQFASAI